MSIWAQMIACVGFVSAAILLVSCAEPPSQPLEAAQKGIEATRTAGAEDYAKEEFAKLEEELRQAKEEIVKQEGALSIFRSYSKADEMLKRVADESKQVEARAVAKKEEAKKTAQTTENEAKAVLASARELLAKAPVGKERAAVQSIKSDLSGIETGLGEVHQLIEKGDYLGAEAKAKALKDKASAVSAEIQKAIEKAKGRKMRTRVS